MTVLRSMLVAALAAAGAGGCAILPPSTDDPYPVYGNPVSPTPVPGYRVRCTTVPSPTAGVFDDYLTGCEQFIDPVVTVRG